MKSHKHKQTHVEPAYVPTTIEIIIPHAMDAAQRNRIEEIIIRAVHNAAGSMRDVSVVVSGVLS